MIDLHKIFALTFLLLGISFSGNTQYTRIRIPVAMDSYTDSQNASTNYGSDTMLYVGTNHSGGTTYYQRTFVYFDLDTIPEGVIIADAKLRMHKEGSITESWSTKLVTSSWHEDTITHTNLPDISSESEDAYNGYTTSLDTITFWVQNVVRNIKWGLKDYYGFCIMLQDETHTTEEGAEFYSRESSDSTNWPFLEVSYFYPHQLANVNISHESDSAAADAVIDLDVLYGSQDFTWQWVDSSGTVISTDTILDSIGCGWYGLHIEGVEWTGEDFYYGFLVGTECHSVDINIRSSQEFSDYAYVFGHNTGTIDNAVKNFGNTTIIQTNEWNYPPWNHFYNYDKMYLWVDPAFNISKADYTMYGSNHYISNWRTDSSEFRLVQESWSEDAITFNNQPVYSDTIITLLDSMSTSTQNNTADMIDFWNYWKRNPQSNYGVLYKLTVEDSSFSIRNQFHSPKASTVTNRPVLEFTVDLYRNGSPSICQPVYANLERRLSGVKYVTQMDRLYFRYFSEYGKDTTLNYNIYSSDNRSSAVMDGTTDTLAVSYGLNQYVLDVSALTTGDIYILEVINEKGEKSYMRFEKD